jgi:shikimate kinase
MTDTRKSVVLIGMPGAGKSTVGILLARELGIDFLDTDIAIQVREARSCQQIMDEDGYLRLREIEEEILLSTSGAAKVIATGGSAVYSRPAMELLKSMGTVIYLRAPVGVLSQRIDNYSTRGVTRQPGQSFENLFEERTVLYEGYAEMTVDCGDRTAAEVVSALVTNLRNL